MRLRRSLYSVRRLQNRRRAIITRAVLVFSAAALVITAFSLLSHQPEISITEVKVNGVSVRTAEQVRVFVLNELSGNYLGIFSYANAFLYPRRGIVSGLLDAFPEFSDAAVNLDGLHLVTVNVAEREPHYLWCDENYTEEVEVERTCYFLDQNSIIFTLAPYFSGPVYFELHGTPEGGAARKHVVSQKPLGYYFLSPEEFHRLIAFRNALTSFGASVKHLRIEDAVAVFTFENGAEIFLDRAQDFDVALENLYAALQTDALQTDDFTTHDSLLEYIDLRFNSRVIYRRSDSTE